jgi:glycosyltransferase involved in cell wall biosynthesis
VKINVVIPSFYPAVVYGGTIFSSFNTCKALANIGQDVRVSTTNTNMYARLEVAANTWLPIENFQVKYYNETKVDKFSIALLFNLWKDIKWADVVHIQAIFNTPTPIALFYAWLFSKPVLLSPRGVMGDWIMNQGNGFKKKWLRFFIQPFANKITWHATAEQEKKEILQHFPKAKIVVVPNGIDLLAFNAEENLTKAAYLLKFTQKTFIGEPKIVVSMGRIHKKKGFDILIKSFADIHTIDNAVLLIAGEDEGALHELKQLVQELNLEKNVFFVGPIDGKDKVDFFIHADLFALTSHNENFGNVYAEALASGIPIIASKNTPWSEIVNNQCGSWVDLDSSDIATAIDYWLEQDKNKDRCRRFISKYSWDEIAKQFDEVFVRMTKQISNK